MKSFDALLDEQMEDPEFRKEYVRLLDEARSRANARADIAEARLAAVEALADHPAAARSGTGDPIAVVLVGDLRAALATGTTTDLRSN